MAEFNYQPLHMHENGAEREKAPQLFPSREQRVEQTLQYAKKLIPKFEKKYLHERRSVLTQQGTEDDPFIVPDTWNLEMTIMQGFVISLTENQNRPVFMKIVYGTDQEVVLEVDGLNRAIVIHQGEDLLNLDLLHEKGGFFDFSIAEEHLSPVELQSLVEFQPDRLTDSLPIIYETLAAHVTGNGLSEETPVRLAASESSQLGTIDGLYAFILSAKEHQPIYLLVHGVLTEVNAEKNSFRYIAGTPDIPEVSSFQLLEIMKKTVTDRMNQVKKFKEMYDSGDPLY